MALPVIFSLGGLAGLTALIIASITDLRTREVPDWLNFSLIAFALGNALIMSIYHGYAHILLGALAGLAIGIAVGLLMFYTGQWGGGDSKLIMGLGALIGSGFGLSTTASFDFTMLLLFFVNTLFAGALYGICFSLGLAIKNYPKCRDEMEARLSTRTSLVARLIILALVILAFANVLWHRSLENLFLFGFALLIFLLFYVWVMITSVEKVCMIKATQVSKLTEGDWVVAPVYKGKKLIMKATKTGVTKEQIAMLKRNGIRSVVLKIGIPFVPSFLIAYLLTFALSAWFPLFF